MKEAKWFKELKKTRKEFNNVENTIEAFKFKYEKESHLTEWILGISTALFFSLSIVDVLSSPTQWIRVTGLIGYIVTLLSILISIWLHSWANKRQKKAMGYLYREKDKQESKKK